MSYSIGLHYAMDGTWTHNIYIKRKMSRLEGLQYAVDGTWTQNIYIKRQTSTLEGVITVVVDMSAS